MTVRICAALAALVLSCGQAARAEDEDWAVSSKVLSCAPKVLKRGGSLTLTLGPNHGAELAVRRGRTRDWYFLVVGAMDEKDLLMTPQAFKSARRVVLKQDIQGVSVYDGKRQSVFARPGRYTFYNSDRLETEGGGIICSIDYRP